jgi:hypothetical protein
MKRLTLIRESMEVAEAVVFSDGTTAILKWLTNPKSVEIYSSEKEMRAVRESSGRSYFQELNGEHS